ncbi:hypothetical protein [Geodermatophilus obscurus]|uniref:hypothetical protein n=1 Tax=Geodermatophilus obscurus TaxID=1861 RepID=UPI00019B7404|nr:hypothetical protein [Geodermatophilus obscurus]
MQWSALEVIFVDSSLPQPDGTVGGDKVQHLAGWNYVRPSGPVEPVLQTADGLTLGSSRQDVLDVYGDQAQEVASGAAGGGSLGVFLGDFGDLVFDFDTDGDVAVMESGQVCD